MEVWKIMVPFKMGDFQVPSSVATFHRKEGEVAPEYPTEACLFGLEVAEKDIDLPSLLVFLG